MRNIELSEIKKMEKQARENGDVISLAQGYPDFSTPWQVVEFVKNHLHEAVWHQYTLAMGNLKLREKIASNLNEEGGSYSPEEIIITAGANAGLMATLLSCFQPGDSIAILCPTYASYFQQFKIAGIIPIFIPLNEKNWSLDLELLSDRINAHKPKAILLCNPNNPTGTLLSKNELLQIANIAEKYNMLILCDEVYSFLVYDNKEYFSLSSLPEFKHNFIKIQSFSKKYAMTGWRIGYICSSKKIIEKILSVHDLLINCAPSVSQLAAISSLENGEKFVNYFKEEFTKRRDLFYDLIQDLNEFLFAYKPQGTYFYFIKLKKNYENFTSQLFNVAKVAVVKGNAFGPFYDNYFRISFAKEPEVLITAVERMKKFFTQLTP